MTTKETTPEKKKEGKLIAEGTETRRIYQVQFRSKKKAFRIEALDVIVDQEWRGLHLRAEDITKRWNVPISSYEADYAHYGVPFQVAEACRWIFISLVGVEHFYNKDLETRIVECELIKQHSVRELQEVTEAPAWQEHNQIWGRVNASKETTCQSKPS